MGASKFKILLADPPQIAGGYDLAYPNLGILYLVGYAKKLISKGILPDIFEFYYLEGFCDLEGHIKRIKEINPDLYGLSFVSLLREGAFKTIRALKREMPNLPILCGGVHPTLNYEEVLRDSPADFCAVGEGEITFTSFLEAFAKRKEDRFSIPGIAFKNNGEIVFSEKRDFVKNLDDISFPDWGLVDFSKYRGNLYRKKSPSTAILASRGCPWNCVFCSNPVWRSGYPRVRLRSPQKIVEEIEMLYNRGIREIYIRSDELNADYKWCLSLMNELEKIKRNDLFFQCNLFLHNIDDNLAKAISLANFWLVHLGIESINQRVLDGIGKYTTVPKMYDILKALKKYSIKIYGFFMMYQLWEEDGLLRIETSEEVENTLRTAKIWYKEGLLDYISWQIASPYPGSKLYDIAIKHKIFRSELQVKNPWTVQMEIPGVDKKEILRKRLKGMVLQARMSAAHGHFGIRSFKNVLRKIKLIIKSVIGLN
ncbi:MAG: hypothetical protein A3C43_00920 [Candidatus Schekmanbacteria bacterium RIFCSPHIGHO2_02_FULL_38_11]|uniref:Uncharacterized protein n=1 Tax=Candidatus Schekmanbacteria bacterium RIFCSPLOWO2_12_FULL_38_15 TaxID=1817883 RepID=A0A1F7SMZ8_9BACT|nr:MAG: hypothetical protein A2043_07965 [Candidatus Schekmanbacteria bacterium GWA2_38_9]OGL50034.1 MAG: hypothetical protein A3C43_00920 [Candidatus Schekmanbacteria bacterium RIFCSPHIGHO2_02_FULL_38_11]OGL51149.1 MAG: hypothetical protein A3H37_08995 [Candidatus Schekmanbacteria bacterium RIFCSPLOWO2_02_FULL_38_14]OGL55149.1 MAG: hypothetical protein A3G31_02820 [Candidatus Schekmanbacteria bacterium RIFCSPLOWO2_12_FULL_38_15]